MLSYIYCAATTEQEEELRDYIQALQNDIYLADFDNENDKLLYIRQHHPISLPLKDEQIRHILNVQSEVVETIAQQVLATQGKALHPNVKKALQIGLCLSALYYVPELMLLYTGQELAKRAVAEAVGQMVGTRAVGQKISNLVVPVSSSIGYFGGMPSLNYFAQLNAVLPEGAKGHLYTQIPCMMLAQNLVKYSAEPLLKLANFALDKEVRETAFDFAEMMWDQDIDEEKLAKYKGSIATMTPDEIVGGIGNMLSWVWKKVSPTRSAPQLSEDRAVVATSKPNNT